MADSSLKAMGYRATRKGGVLTVHNVPIFVDCARGDLVFDASWVAEAVKNAKLGERENYFPPLHIRHHEAETDVRPAGFFRILGTQAITFKGARRTAIMADLVVTDESAQAEVLSMRLPYRSVEIPREGPPSIRGLALLDHEAPFLQLPMLAITDLADEDENIGGVANATFKHPWVLDATHDDQPVVACFSNGDRAHLLFEDQDMTIAEKKLADEEAKKKASTNFEADKDKADEDTENMESDGDGEGSAKLDVSAVVKAIESGEIAVKDMDAILMAIQSQKTDVEEEEGAGMANTPAAAAAPGAEAMSAEDKDLTIKMAAMEGENEALKGRLDAMDAEKKRNQDVASAMSRLKDRPLGAGLEDRLVKFHAEHGADAFSAHVEAMEKAAAPVRDDSGKALAFSSQQGGDASTVAMKYQEHGVEAVEKAIGFSSIWRDLKERGMTRKSEEEYVQINMATLDTF